MKNNKNKGFIKPALLTLSAAIIAGLGYLAYTQMSTKQVVTITQVDTSDLSMESVDTSSPESIAAALYTSVLTENFTEVPNLVDKFRELEYIQANIGNPYATKEMTEEEKNMPVDISKYLTRAAIEKLNDKLAIISDKILAKQHPDSYKFYLNALRQVLSFYQPNEDFKSIANSLKAYQAYKENIDYTINDIRAIYGPIDSIRMCRYLIGMNDYSKISPYEMKFYIIEEINRLIKQLPTFSSKKVEFYSNSDFISINQNAIADLKRLNIIIPQAISYIPLIDGVKKEELERDFNNIVNSFNKTVSSSVEYSEVAKVFYQCKATTSEEFTVTPSSIGQIYKNVAKVGNINLHAIPLKLSTPLPGCGNIDNIYVLVPDLQQYRDQFNKAKGKISEKNKNVIKNDLTLLENIYAKSVTNTPISLLGSDIGAVEEGYQASPETGLFVNKKDNGLLFNIKLDSFKLLKTLSINPSVDLIFTSSKKLSDTRNHAIFKLNIVSDILEIEKSLATIDFKSIISAPDKYLGERNKEIAKIGHNFETSEFARDYLISTANREESASSFNYEDTSFAFNDDSTLGNQTETYAFSESDSIGQTIATTSISDSEEIPTDAASIDNLIAEHTETVANTSTENTTSATTETTTTETTVAASTTTPETTTPAATTEATGTTEVAQTTPSAADYESPAYADEFLTPEELAEANNNVILEQIKKGSGDAAYEYAVRLTTGKHKTKKDSKLARAMLEKAAQLEHPIAIYEIAASIKANKNATKKQIAKANEDIIKAAELGNSKAMSDAGQLYLEGKQVQQDYTKALNYLTIAAEHNDKKAQYLLATMYLEGKGVTTNKSKALNLLTTAAKGNAEAAYQLAKIYEGGIISDIKDERLATDNYIFAARHGYKAAYKNAGLELIKTKIGSKEALKYLQPLVGTDPQIDKALLEYYISVNDSKQIGTLIIKAPKEVQEQYPVEMGDIYFYGQGVPQSYTKAEEYYRKGTSMNIPDAFCRIGDMYNYGKGKAVDLKAAVAQYTNGASYGSATCAKSLALIKIGYNKFKNLEESFALLSSLPTDVMDDNSRGILGIMYLYGQGTRKDVNTGLNFLNKTNTRGALFVRALHSGDTSTMQKYACLNPVLAGVLGSRTNNLQWTSVALLGDLFFIKEYKDRGGNFNFTTIWNNSHNSNTCASSLNPSIFYDAINKFKIPASDAGITDPKQLYQAGMANFTAKNYDKAFEQIKAASEAGEVKAHNNLGLFYLFGIGTDVNMKEAYASFMKGVSKGDHKATFNAAALKKNGLGAKPEHNKAMDLLRSAIAQGDMVASMHLGYTYDYGVGNPQNDTEAFNAMINVILNYK